MKTKSVKIRDIDTLGRSVDPLDKGWTIFRDHVRKHGLEVPPLVDDQNRLLDGIRRVMALDLDTEIDVVVSESFEDTIEYLEKHKMTALRYTPRRVWELYVATTDQRTVYSMANKVNQYLVLRGEPRKNRKMYTRGRLSSVVGHSEHWLQSVHMLYSRVKGDVPEDEKWMPLLRKLVAYMDNGGNPYTALTEWRKARTAGDKTILSESRQRAVLRRSISGLRGITQGLSDLGSLNSRLKVEERLGYAEDLRNIRKVLTATIQKLSEGKEQ